MNYGLTATPALNTTECLIIGLFSDDDLPDFAQAINTQHHGLLDRLAKKLHEAGDTIGQADIDGHGLLMIHCGNKADFSADKLAKRINDIAGILLKQRTTQATICLPQLAQHSADWQVQQMIIQLEAQRYQLLDFKSKNNKPYPLQSILFFLTKANDSSVDAGHAIAEGIRFTRTLANLPANVCTPTYLGKQALELAIQHKQIKTKVLELDDIRKLGMGSLLAVAQGSIEPPRFIEMQYNGAGDKPPIVLVGKGITFDSGGLSLKPADAMIEMKYDMSGAACVLGTLKACALLQLPINVVGLIASAENMPGGKAVKPGDVVTSMSGQTVEIINTDAEGRLVLSDALTYAERFKPSLVIDIATLTGAMVVALGSVASGFMTADEELAEMIITAARDSEDKVWRMPLDEAYQEAIDSPIADMVNATFDRTAGAITAACFLSRYTSQYRWAHIDVAGTAWVSGKKRNATGRPVPLLIQLLRHAATR